MCLAALVPAAAAGHRVLVVSVDGLDARYLNDRDRLGLKIPNMRRLLAQGQSASGVIGVNPTVTWPSHTTIISGVPPRDHGILGNRRPRSEGGDYYWSAKLLKVKTLLDAAQRAGKTTAAVTWPVTVDAPLTYNLPEYFQRRRGGAMDLPSIASKSVPVDLAQQISAKYPSFGQEWMDDRTRTLATLFLLERYHPDLVLVHLVDHDSEAHDNRPFSPPALAILEYTDELIGQMLAALPEDYIFVLTSDHGFEGVDREVNLGLLARQAGVTGVRTMGAIAIAESEEALRWLRQQNRNVGRAIPTEEIQQFAPQLASAASVFESATGVWFAASPEAPVEGKPHEAGAHGHWPMRYRSVFVACGPGVSQGSLGEISLTAIAGRLAQFLAIGFSASAEPR